MVDPGAGHACRASLPRATHNRIRELAMRRKTLDMIMTAGGAVLIVILLVAGVLGMWGYNFANSNVHDQLAQQAITFPPAAAFAHPKVGSEITPSMIPSVSKYAGQPLLTGQQAQVYANDFIAVHLQEIGGGKTYAQLSAAAQATRATRCWPARWPRSSRGRHCEDSCSRPTPSRHLVRSRWSPRSSPSCWRASCCCSR